MAYTKKQESTLVSEAKVRLQMMKEIDVSQGKMVEYGDPQKNPVNSSLLGSKLQAYDTLLGEINQLLAKVDEKINEKKSVLGEISDLHTMALQGAKVKFGLDSSEVEKMGGKRKSERKKPAPKKKKKEA